MDHDFDNQMQETRWVWNDLSAKHDLPNNAVLDLQFVPDQTGADWNLFQKILTEAGYESSVYEDGSTIEASIGPIKLGFEEIWRHEECTTKLALKCGFSPDGWGFSD